MSLDLEYFLEKVMPYFEEEDWGVINDTFETLNFKYNKCSYHLEIIRNKIKNSRDFEQENYYEMIHYPLYYELESFLIAIRSSVDIIMHILNRTLKLDIENSYVNLGSVYKHPKTSKVIKNILHQYTHNRESQTWNFIYQYRNEIVHEKSINQSLYLNIDIFRTDEPQAYFELNGEQKNIITFLESCLNFLKRFATHLVEAIVVTMSIQKR